MKSLMKNKHNKNHFQGQTHGRGGVWSQQDQVDPASQGNALLRPLERGSSSLCEDCCAGLSPGALGAGPPKGAPTHTLWGEPSQEGLYHVYHTHEHTCTTHTTGLHFLRPGASPGQRDPAAWPAPGALFSGTGMTWALRTTTWKAKTLAHCGGTHPGRPSPHHFPNQEDPLPTSWTSLLGLLTVRRAVPHPRRCQDTRTLIQQARRQLGQLALPLLAVLLSTAPHGSSVQPLHTLLAARPPNTGPRPRAFPVGQGSSLKVWRQGT